MLMKKVLTIILLLFCVFTYANKPKLFLILKEKATNLEISSETIWNADSSFDTKTYFKNKGYTHYFSGNNEEFVKTFSIKGYSVRVVAFFPKQLRGRKLNATTTIHLSVFIDNIKVFHSEHFGQLSEEFVKKEYEILPRPLFFELSFDNPKKSTTDFANIRITGDVGDEKYTDGGGVQQNKFEINYAIPQSGNVIINDAKLAKDERLYKTYIQTIKEPLSSIADNSKKESSEKGIQKRKIESMPRVKETLEIFQRGDKAYQTYYFATHDHEDSFDITEEDWYEYYDLRLKGKYTDEDLKKLIIQNYERISSNGNDIIRIYDPEFTLFSNTILFDKSNVTYEKDTILTLTNAKQNILAEGLDLMDSIHKSEIKLIFSSKHNVISVKAEPSNVGIERKNNTIIFSGNDTDKIRYWITYSIPPDKWLVPSPEYRTLPYVELHQKEYTTLLKSKKPSTVNVYINGLLIAENIQTTNDFSPLYPFVLDKDIDSITIKNKSRKTSKFTLRLKELDDNTVNDIKLKVDADAATTIPFVAPPKKEFITTEKTQLSDTHADLRKYEKNQSLIAVLMAMIPLLTLLFKWLFSYRKLAVISLISASMFILEILGIHFFFSFPLLLSIAFTIWTSAVFAILLKLFFSKGLLKGFIITILMVLFGLYMLGTNFFYFYHQFRKIVPPVHKNSWYFGDTKITHARVDGDPMNIETDDIFTLYKVKLGGALVIREDQYVFSKGFTRLLYDSDCLIPFEKSQVRFDRCNEELLH